MPSDAEVKAIFAAFDTDSSGYISVDELGAALAKGGKEVNQEQLDKMVADMDCNKDGQISLEEFQEAFRRSPDTSSILKPMTDVADMLATTFARMGRVIWAPFSSGNAPDWRDTNVAGLGSAEDKALRKTSAAAEEAWHGCGMEPGIEIWRIEKFKVVPWPEKLYGKFYDGDSFIVLHTYKESMMSSKLEHDIYFWLGKKTSQDEMGTAAYKTVELDDLFDGEPVQHREVMCHESDAFKALFKGSISYMKGGVASGLKAGSMKGFDAFVAKLYHVKKVGKQTSLIEVSCKRESLNDGDAFILDAGQKIYCWYGASCSPFEKLAANLEAEKMEANRHGQAKTTIEIEDEFWSKLGGKGAIASKDSVPEVLPKSPPPGEGLLYKLSDASGKLQVTEVGRGDLKASMLTQEDVYVCDPTPASEIIVWIGSRASAKERDSAMYTAEQYLKMQGRPVTTAITVLKEGQTNRHPLFKKIFD